MIDEENPDDVDMKDENNNNDATVDYDQMPNIALQSQEMYQAIKCLQSYYKVIIPSHQLADEKSHQNIFEEVT